MFEVHSELYFLSSLSLSLPFVLALVASYKLLYSNEHCPTVFFFSLSFALSIVWLSLPLSHRLIHHQRPGALQYIYYIGYVLVIVVRDIKGVDGEEEEEEEREIESAVYITQMYVFVLFLIITLFFLSLFLSRFFFFVIEMLVNDLDKMHRYCVVSVSILSFSP
jgi:hypothetical protein